MNRLTIVILSAIILPVLALAQRPTIDLEGQWMVSLGSQNAEAQHISLPGTLDEAGIGTPNDNYEETTQLSRKVTYMGPAYYSRQFQVPESWRGMLVQLTLERTRPTTIYIDNEEVGSSNIISAAQKFELGMLEPGSHTLTVMVDNGERIPEQIKSNSHACTESTQTNWNGILGKIQIEAMQEIHIESLRCRTLPGHCIEVTARVANPVDGMKLIISSGEDIAKIKMKSGSPIYTAIIELGDTGLTWSERQPTRHLVSARIPNHDEMQTYTGWRDFKALDQHFYINDTLTFLRGRHDACVFPLTGYPPMDVESWRKYFKTIKDYGLNHVRFHSWTPPEACFEAADLEGIYLQPELPIWGTFNRSEKELMDFLHEDGMEILNAYYNHPSMVMFSLGNELWGEEDLMDEFVTDFRTVAPHLLYAYGSNAYLGYNGAQPGEDFFVTCRVGAGDGYDGYSSHTRASFSFADAADGGILNHFYPGSKINFQDAICESTKPIIGHETGQYQIYPNYDEMDKYTGVLEPRNFAIFKQRLEDANLGQQAKDFAKASGRWAAKLYKADIEMNLRTPSMAGFQLLDIQDYSGQGTALVGILDAFMESKGAITPEEWRQTCAPVTLMGEFDKFCFYGGDRIRGNLSVANYGGKELAGRNLRWQLLDDDDIMLYSETLRIPAGQGYLKVDTISWKAPVSNHPYRMKLKLELLGQPIDNEYTFWIYPLQEEYSAGQNSQDAYVCDNLDEAIQLLDQGKKVLLMPNHEDVAPATIGGLFQTDYWNYRMFKTISTNNNKPVSPGTMGLLINHQHPALAAFPTDFHTDWQWYIPAKEGYPLVLDALNEADYRPIVQVIDNIERNHRLGLMMEFAVGDGELMLLMVPIEELNSKPEGRQLITSTLSYMNSDAFHPSTTLTSSQLHQLLTSPASDSKINELRNISYD